MPSTPQVPAGYTFGGWKVRVATASTFDLSTLAQYMDENGGTRYYQRRNRSTGAAECRHNASGSFATVDCSDPLVSDLSMSEWKVDFTYGTVKGIGICSLTPEGNTTPTDDWMQKDAKYCWCGVTAFDAEKNGSFLPVAGSRWVSRRNYGNASICADGCAYVCTISVGNYDGIRHLVFGVTQ